MPFPLATTLPVLGSKSRYRSLGRVESDRYDCSAFDSIQMIQVLSSASAVSRASLQGVATPRILAQLILENQGASPVSKTAGLAKRLRSGETGRHRDRLPSPARRRRSPAPRRQSRLFLAHSPTNVFFRLHFQMKAKLGAHLAFDLCAPQLRAQAMKSLRSIT